jgi:hypothetical protein
MSQTALNLSAIAIFIMTMSVLLAPLFHFSSAFPALATFAILGLATLDSFTFQGQGSNVFLDWVAGFSPAHRERIIHHEAGHFLVAHRLEIPISGYTLTAWEAIKQKQPGQGGVSFNDAELTSQLQKGQITAQMLDRYCTVWMAGIAAETIVYSSSEGGADDRNKLAGVLKGLGFAESIFDQKQRFCALQAKTLLEENWQAYQVLVEAMRQRVSVPECIKLIDDIELGVEK